MLVYLEHLEEQFKQLHFPLDIFLRVLYIIYKAKIKIKIVIDISINNLLNYINNVPTLKIRNDVIQAIAS